MRSSVHTSEVKFRVADQLIDSARAKAARDGQTLSELIRHALRRELRDAA